MGGTGWTAGPAALIEQERSAALGARGSLFPGCRRRGGEARERRLEPEARPAGSQRSAAGARPRRGRGKKNTLFPLGPPPRIMYQDYPGNFDTSSRGSSGSPAHAESYSSGGGGQQVGAGPGCTWRRGRIPAILSPPLPLLLSFPFLGLARKFLRATVVSSGFSSCSAHTSFHPLYPPPTLFFFFKWSVERAGTASKPYPSHYILSRPAPGIAGPLPRSLYLISQESTSILLSFRGGKKKKFFAPTGPSLHLGTLFLRKTLSFSPPAPIGLNFWKMLGTRKHGWVPSSNPEWARVVALGIRCEGQEGGGQP